MTLLEELELKRQREREIGERLGLLPVPNKWDMLKQSVKEAITEDLPRQVSGAVASINDAASFGAIPAIQERIPPWAGGVPVGTYQNAMAAAPLAAMIVGTAAPNPLGPIGKAAKATAGAAKGLAAKILRREKYPLLDPGIAETMMAAEAERLASAEAIGVRGDDFGPVERFRNSRYHQRLDEDIPGGSRVRPGVSAIDVSDGAGGLNREAMDTAFDFEQNWNHVGPVQKPVNYGDRVFVLKGKRSGIPDDPGEVLLGNHRIMAEVKVPGRSYAESEADKAVNDSINEYLRRKDAERAATSRAPLSELLK